jgi:hypothetical protein
VDLGKPRVLLGERALLTETDDESGERLKAQGNLTEAGLAEFLEGGGEARGDRVGRFPIILKLTGWIRGTTPSTFEQKRAQAHQIGETTSALEIDAGPGRIRFGRAARGLP